MNMSGLVKVTDYCHFLDLTQVQILTQALHLYENKTKNFQSLAKLVHLLLNMLS